MKLICIAGKNQCAVDAIKFVLSKIKKKNILVLPNPSDFGKDSWQPSLKAYALKKKIQIISLKQLYSLKMLFLFSLEYESIFQVKNFASQNLYNFHFSILPKYRGCHPNYMQILNGEKYSGVTLHKINNKVDGGHILDVSKFKIKTNDTAFDNYKTLMKHSVKLFKKNFFKILNERTKLKKQKLKYGSYFNRKSVNYLEKKYINYKKPSLKIHNKIRAMIFPPFQYPVVNGIPIKKSIYNNKKIKLHRLTQ